MFVRGIPMLAAVLAAQVVSTCATPPTVISTAPTAGATVDAPTAITATFSQVMDPASINSATFVVRQGDQVGVRGSVSATGKLARFTPEQPLTAGAAFYIHLSDMRSAAGIPLAQAYDWSFNTQPSPPEVSAARLSVRGDAQCLAVASSKRGGAMVVWREVLAGSTSIAAGYYDPDLGWQAPVYVTDVGDNECPLVGMDEQGRALAVWQKVDASGTHIWSSKFDEGSWSTELRIDPLRTGTATQPHLAVNVRGAGLVAWIYDDGVATTEAAFFDPDAGWAAESALADPLPGLAQNPKVALNERGVGIVSWNDIHPGHGLIWASLHAPGGSWSDPVPSASLSNALYYNSSAIDGSGNGFVTCSRLASVATGDEELGVYVSRYDAAMNVWDVSPELDTLPGPAHSPSIVANRRGLALDAWFQVAAGAYQPFAALYAPASGWRAPVALGTGSANPQVTLNDSGEGAVGWLEHNTDVVFSRLHAGAFRPKVTLHTGCGTCSSPAFVAMDETGTLTAAWNQGDSIIGPRTVYAVRDGG